MSLAPARDRAEVAARMTPRMTLRWTRVALLGGLVVLAGGARSAAAQSPVVLRLALLSQWTVDQHRAGWGTAPGSPMRPDFAAALRDGVRDGLVFRWQHGAIQRGSLVLKPIRVVSGEEAQTLGGRGAFELGEVRPPRGRAAWTEIEVRPRSAAPDGVLVLEVGGEIYTIRQVLASLFVVPSAGEPRELRLVQPALRPGTGVPVVQARFGLPVTRPDAAGLFQGGDAAGFLVVRSEVQTITENVQTTNGPADLSPVDGGAWREGDRVFLRVPLATLQQGAPAVVLGWKDRIFQDTNPGDNLIFSGAALPGIRSIL
jgi:hypothetical protein